MADFRECTLVTSERGLVESPRWHDGHFWFADWTVGEILRLNENGTSEVFAKVPAPPLSFDFAQDGSMLIVSSSAGQLLKQPNGQGCSIFSELGGSGWNEIVVDGRGNAYVNGPLLVLVTPTGHVSEQASDFAFPNGMAVTPDNGTLIVAESHARRLTAFDIRPDGRLFGRRVWATLDSPPDGICVDDTGAVWYADVPNKRCRRIREGGEVLDEVKVDRGAFACMLGGPERRTLMIAAAGWFGLEHMDRIAGTGQILETVVERSGAGWP